MKALVAPTNHLASSLWSHVPPMTLFDPPSSFSGYTMLSRPEECEKRTDDGWNLREDSLRVHICRQDNIGASPENRIL